MIYRLEMSVLRRSFSTLYFIVQERIIGKESNVEMNICPNKTMRENMVYY